MARVIHFLVGLVLSVPALGGEAPVVLLGVPDVEVSDVLATHAGRGLMPTQLNGYGTPHGDRYALVLVESDGRTRIARFGMTRVAFDAEIRRMAAKDLRPLTISAFASSGQARYAALFGSQGSSGGVVESRLTEAEYRAACESRAASGLEVVEVCGFVLDAQDLYAARWERRSGPPLVVRHAIPFSETQSVCDELKGEGYRPLRVSRYGGKASEIWEESRGGGWVLRSYLRGEGEFLDERRRVEPGGFSVSWLSVRSYGEGEEPVVSAIWTKPIVPRQVRPDPPDDAEVPTHVGEAQRSPLLPDDAILLLDQHDAFVVRTRDDAARRILAAEARCAKALEQLVEERRREGDLGSMERVLALLESPDQALDGLPDRAQRAIHAFRAKRSRETDRAEQVIARNRTRTIRDLERLMARETRESRLPEARAIRSGIDELVAVEERAESERARRQSRETLVGAWGVTIGQYRAVWTFSEDGEVEATDGRLGKERLDDDRATWRLRGADVLIDWAGLEDWSTFRFPIEAEGTVGDSWRGAGSVRATKHR